MPTVKNNSVPTGEIVRELAGKTLGSAIKTSHYVQGRTLVLPLTGGLSSNAVQVIAVENPESYPLLIRGVTIVVTTHGGVGTSSAAINIGIVASSSKTDADIFSSGPVDNALGVGTRQLIIGYTPQAGSGSSGLSIADISIWEKNGASSDAWLTARLVGDSASCLAGYLMVDVVPLFST